MSRGDKLSYSSKQKSQAKHISQVLNWIKR